MDAQVPVVAEDVQVAAKARRRTYTAEYKRRILKEADEAHQFGTTRLRSPPVDQIRRRHRRFAAGDAPAAALGSPHTAFCL
jgi:hypothetical protein